MSFKYNIVLDKQYLFLKHDIEHSVNTLEHIHGGYLAIFNKDSATIEDALKRLTVSVELHAAAIKELFDPGRLTISIFEELRLHITYLENDTIKSFWGYAAPDSNGLLIIQSLYHSLTGKVKLPSPISFPSFHNGVSPKHFRRVLESIKNDSFLNIAP